MAETIESFVAKLQAEGVEAGQQAAEKIIAEAKQQAERLIEDSQDNAAKIVAEAEKQADRLLQRSKSDIELAARDIVGKLKDALSQALTAVLTRASKEVLTDEKFLTATLHGLISAYAKADIERDAVMEIDVSAELRGKLAEWAIKEFQSEAEEAGISVDLRGSLSTAGFEYKVSGATVEVTLDSVVETLNQLIDPQLREIVNAAVADNTQTGEGGQ